MGELVFGMKVEGNQLVLNFVALINHFSNAPGYRLEINHLQNLSHATLRQTSNSSHSIEYAGELNDEKGKKRTTTWQNLFSTQQTYLHIQQKKCTLKRHSSFEEVRLTKVRCGSMIQIQNYI